MRKWLLTLMLMGVLNVRVTGYRPVHGEGGPIAADGKRIVVGQSCAVSRDLKHLFGKYIHIEGVGRRYVHDLTSRSVRCTVDVAVSHNSEASALTRKNVSIKVVD